MTTLSFFDQLGNDVTLPHPPAKIVSLVPSQTELLADLGLDQQVVGLTKFCIHPEHWLRTKTIVGGTKNFQFDTIDSLRPDLIIGNKEENYIEGIARLKEKYPVWMSDVVSLENAYAMMSSIGAITDRQEKALSIRSEIERRFTSIVKRQPQSVLYLIWRNPWMAAGRGTFIHTMLTCMNLKNAAENLPRYPKISTPQINELKPDLIFLSSEPYPFREKHIEELREIAPYSKAILVDGEMFSWYGSRLLKSVDYFNHLIL
jgi:ABC-type Fe3+-hydroxamate transport system substrate-binding protein